METIPYPLRIPDIILALARLRAKEENIDQATALRQLLYLGSEGYVLSLLTSGRISVGRAAELLNTSIADVHRIAEKHGVQLGASAEQQRKSLVHVKKFGG